MEKIKWYERLMFSTTITLIAYFICLILSSKFSDLWIWFGVGSFGFNIIHHIIIYFKLDETFRKNFRINN